MTLFGAGVPVKVSAKMARQLFHGCDPDYIANVCHASCCQSSVHPSGTRIAVHPSEVDGLVQLGATVTDNYIDPVNKRCPFKSPAHLCGLHGTGSKPFGCIASPFTLTATDTLIVRNRYRSLRCYGAGIPAYVAFRSSLDLIFGPDEARRVCDLLDGGGGDVSATATERAYMILRANAVTRKGADGSHPAVWP